MNEDENEASNKHEASDKHEEHQFQQSRLKIYTHPKRCIKRHSPNFQPSFSLITDDSEPSSFQEARKYKNIDK